jgi:hypothetical protein
VISVHSIIRRVIGVSPDDAVTADHNPLILLMML